MKVLENDIEEMIDNFPFPESIKNKSFLITGGTGLIGSIFIKFLEKIDDKKNLNLTIFATSRNLEKTKKQKTRKTIWLIDINSKINYPSSIDYIIHTACPTQTLFLKNYPVEVINDTLDMARSLFEYCKNNGSKLVYLSSIEVYGQFFMKKDVEEDDYGYLNHLKARRAYSESKKLIECLLSSYVQEYGVDLVIARLTQTFGAGIDENDNRVFAQFARAVIDNKDIILHTNGISSKSYIYTTDAVLALLYLLIKGKSGEAYNIANDETYISIFELAKFVTQNFNKKTKIYIQEIEQNSYAPDTQINLNVQKLKDLGWFPRVDLFEMFKRMIDYIKEDRRKGL